MCYHGQGREANALYLDIDSILFACTADGGQRRTALGEPH